MIVLLLIDQKLGFPKVISPGGGRCHEVTEGLTDRPEPRDKLGIIYRPNRRTLKGSPIFFILSIQ